MSFVKKILRRAVAPFAAGGGDTAFYVGDP
jgi:hypothetical protein